MPKTNNVIKADCTLPELQARIEELAGGKTLKELLNEGLLRRADGTPFLEEGHTLSFEPDQKRYNEPEYDALMAAKEGGAFLYTKIDHASPRPCFIKGDGENVKITAPLEDNEVVKVMSEACGNVKKPDPVKRPGIGNRIRNFFKRGGTPEMNAYKQYQKDLKAYNEFTARIGKQAESMKKAGKAYAETVAEEIHTGKDFKQTVNVGIELKERYDRMTIAPCAVGEGEVSRANDLLNDTRVLLAPVHIGIMTSFVSDKKGVSKGLAAMTAMDLILSERHANGYEKGDGKTVNPGPLEKILNNVGENEFINMIAENDVFKAETKDMNSKKLDDFVTKNQVHTLSNKVLKSLAGSDKKTGPSPDQPELGKNAKTVEEPGNKNVPSVGGK